MATTGNVYGLQDGVVYLKQWDTFDPFTWGGRCMRLEEGTETLGGVTVTTRFNPRGGVERGGVRMEPPGATSTSIVMKRLQADTMKTTLRTCLWNVDERMHCSGVDRDSPFAWKEITRYCQAKMSDRAVAGSSWDADEDAMITFTVTSMMVDDIYRVTGEEAIMLGSSTSTSSSSSSSTSLSTSSTSQSTSTTVSTSLSTSTSVT